MIPISIIPSLLEKQGRLPPSSSIGQRRKWITSTSVKPGQWVTTPYTENQAQVDNRWLLRDDGYTWDYVKETWIPTKPMHTAFFLWKYHKLPIPVISELENQDKDTLTYTFNVLRNIYITDIRHKKRSDDVLE